MVRETDPLLGHSNGHGSEQSPERSGRWTLVKRRMGQSVDAGKCYPALTIQCFIAGAADAAAYGYTKTWVAFMTGNLTQLSIASITLLLTHPMPEESISRFGNSSASVLGFIFGSFFSSQITARYHKNHRGKLVITSLLRFLVFIAVAVGIATLGWGGRPGMVMLFALATNMGIMAVNASQVGTTPYSTTVVFTASLAAFFSDPFLPFSISSGSKTRGVSILALIAGACTSQAISILAARMLLSSMLSLDSTKELLAPSIPFAMVAIVELLCAFLWLQAGKQDD